MCFGGVLATTSQGLSRQNVANRGLPSGSRQDVELYGRRRLRVSRKVLFQHHAVVVVTGQHPSCCLCVSLPAWLLCTCMTLPDI